MDPVVVHNLCSIDKTVEFNDMTPEQAVVAAYEESQGNFDRSTYPEPSAHPQYIECVMTVACGDFSAQKNLNAEEKELAWKKLFEIRENRQCL